MTDQARLHLAWIFESDNGHAHPFGWFEHCRLIVDKQALGRGVCRFLQDQFVNPGIRFPDADPMREHPIFEAMQKPVRLLQVFDSILDIVGEIEEFVTGNTQSIDQAYRAVDRFIGLEPGGRELLGRNL